jgi:hypothetical protein
MQGSPDPAPAAGSGADPGPLRETLRLASDLADALVTQANRAKRQYGDLAAPGDSALTGGLIDAIASEAEKIRNDCAQLRRTLVPAEARAERRKPAPAVAVDAQVAEQGEGKPGTQDPARMLAIEMVTQGRSRAEVEDYLVDTFGLDNASSIVEEVFRSQGR